MHYSRIKGRSHARSETGTISKGAQLALLLCGLLGIASVLLVSSATMAIPNATASNQDDRSGGQVNGKAPPGMAWIPGGAFLMGTNDKESFPNEKYGPRNLVHCWATDVEDPTEMPRWGKVGKQRIVDEGPLAPFPDMSGREDWQEGRKAKYDMETYHRQTGRKYSPGRTAG